MIRSGANNTCANDEGDRAMAVGHVLTAFARLEDAVRARASGYQGHLAKPLSPEDLVAAVARLQGSKDPAGP